MEKKLECISFSPWRTFRSAALAGLTVLLLDGCSFTHTYEPEYNLDGLTAPGQMPLRMGVYYSPEFREYEHVRAFGSDLRVVPIGAESVKMFDQLLPRVFEQVISVPNLHPMIADGETLDGIIETSIESFGYPVGFEEDDPRFGVTYRIMLYSQEGIPVASWLVKGKEADPPTALWNRIGADMRAAGEEFLALFERPSGGGESPFGKEVVLLTDARRADAPQADKLSVSAEAVTATTDQEEFFGTSGVAAVVVTIRARIEYRGSDGVMVQPWAARLVLPDGRAMPSSSPARVLSRLENPNYDLAVAAAVVSPLLVLAAAPQYQARTQELLALQEELRERELRATNRGGEGAVDGLLYFVPAEGTAAFDNARLRLWFTTAAMESFVIEVPVNDIGFAGSDSRQRQRPGSERTSQEKESESGVPTGGDGAENLDGLARWQGQWAGEGREWRLEMTIEGDRVRGLARGRGINWKLEGNISENGILEVGMTAFTAFDSGYRISGRMPNPEMFDPRSSSVKDKIALDRK